jgi:hypothetical protein
MVLRRANVPGAAIAGRGATSKLGHTRSCRWRFGIYPASAVFVPKERPCGVECGARSRHRAPIFLDTVKGRRAALADSVQCRSRASLTEPALSLNRDRTSPSASGMSSPTLRKAFPAPAGDFAPVNIQKTPIPIKAAETGVAGSGDPQILGET